MTEQGMDWLTFISSVVKSTAWPIVAAGAFYYVIQNTKQIAVFIKSFKYKDIEVVLRDQFSEAKELSDEIKIASKAVNASAVSSESEGTLINKLVKTDPPIAILKIWQGLEAKIIKCVQFNGLMRFTSPMSFMEELAKAEKITGAELKLFNRLRSIRNEVVHGPAYSRQFKISSAEVVEYQELTDTLIQRIEVITKDAGQGNYFTPTNVPT